MNTTIKLVTPIYFLLWIFLAAGLFWTKLHAQTLPEKSPPPTGATTRLAAHHEAVDILSKTHFSKDGRGMVLGPDMIKVFKTFGKLIGLPDLDRDQKFNEKDEKNSVLRAFNTRFGLIEEDGEFKGFYSQKVQKVDVGLMGCIVCHSGRAAGIYWLGIGNKNIDIGQISTDAYKATEMWKKMMPWKRRDPVYREIQDQALDFSYRLSREKYNNLTQGLVPVSMIRQWFYTQVGEDLPANDPRSQVKVPNWWGYGEKRFIGQFCDGFGDGTHAGWGLAVELAGTQTAETIHELMPKIEHAEELLGRLLPPPYPFSIEAQQVAAGKVVFEKNCMGCHGSYERDTAGVPIFKAPKFIPIAKVGTDDDRLKGNTDRFKQLVDTNVLSEYIKRNDREPGYFAPRLEGIWARFPYLHNGSVPTLWDLLTHPDQRPQAFSLVDAGEKHRFDEEKLGLTLERTAAGQASLLKEAQKGNRQIYFTERNGHSSQGHWFKFSDGLTSADKKALIEYLKSI
jgi:hypothetical protein